MFDAPTRDACTARRITTNSPLQALVTLNDPAHMEFAKSATTTPAPFPCGWQVAE
jgi:hypothetical protein